MRQTLDQCGNCGEEGAIVPVLVEVGTRRANIHLCDECVDSFKRTAKYYGLDVYFDNETQVAELLMGGNA